jgi:hypothetical protein
MKAQRGFMNCDLFEELIADLDRAEILPGELRAAALEHAESCATCGTLLTESESLDLHLRSLAASLDFQGLSPRVESDLLREFREHGRNGRSGWARRRVAAVGIAAAVALAAGLLVRGHYALKDKGTTGTEVTGGHPTEAPALTIPAPRTQEVAGSDRKRSGLRQYASNPPHATPLPDSEEASFISLPYSDGAGEIEDGEVVRVILSPVALESLGVRPPDVASTANVSADLLLDEDGTPEAIRLVAQSENGSVPN